MRLHLPKALLAAVLAACLAWPSFGGTSTVTSETTTIDGVQYSGYVIEYVGTGNQNFHQGTFATTTAATDTTGRTLSIPSTMTGGYTTVEAYSDGNKTFNQPNNLYILFANATNNVNDHTYGHTLKLNSPGSTASTNLTLTCSFSPITLGGLISMGSASSYTLTTDSSTRNIELTGKVSSGVNMAIGVNTTLNAKTGAISINTGGSWVISKGKSLTLSSTSTNGVTIASGQNVNVSASGDGTGNASLAFTGNIKNSGTLSIGSGVNMTVASGKTLNTTTITNDGTITLANGAIIALEQLLATSDFTTTATTTGAYTATNGAFTFATGNGTVNVGDTLSCTYNGATATVTWNDGHKTGTASVPYYYIAEGGAATYTEAAANTPAWITVSERATLSGLSGTIETSIQGSVTLSMSAGSGQVTIAADRLTEFTGDLVVNSGRFNEVNNGHVFSNVTVTNGGQFCINNSYNYTGDVSISGTGWNDSDDAAKNGALRLGEESTLSGTLSLSSDASICVHSNHGTIASSANWTNKVTKVGGGELWLTGSVNIGDVDVSAGTFSLGKLKGPDVTSQQISVGNVTVNDGSTFSVGYTKGTVESVSLATNATLRYYDNKTALITEESNTTTIKKLTVSAAANLQADWKGTLNVSELTGAGNLSLKKTQSPDAFYLNISSIKDYSGTISGPTSNGTLMTVTIGEANISDAASTATVSANVTLKNGFTKTGAGAVSFGGTTTATDVTVSSGRLTFAGGTSISKLSLNGGSTTISGTTNELSGAVKVSEGATLTLAGTTTLSNTLSFESSTTASDSVVKPLVEVTGGTTTISNVVSGSGVMKVSGGTLILNGSNTYTNETRLSGGTIQAGNTNAFGASKLIVDGTGSISGTATIAEFIGLESRSKLTIKENSAITLSNSDANKGIWIASGSSVALESGASITGYNVTVSYLNANSKLAAEGADEGQFGTCDHKFENAITIKESAISLANGAVLRNKLDSGTVSSTGNTKIGWVDNNVNYGGGSISSLEVTSGTLSVVSELAVTTGTSVAANAKVDVSNADTSLGAVSGAGTVSSSVNQSVTLARDAGGTASTFSGTLEATGNQMTVTSVGSESLNLAGIKANGGGINVMATSGDAIFGIVVSVSDLVIGAGSTVGVYKGSTVTETEEGDVYVYGSTDKKGSLTISGTEARLNANLTIVNTALTLDGVLTMGSTLTLCSGNTLSGSLLTDWTDRTQALTLFEGVDGLYFNNDTKGAQVGVEYNASTVFDGMTGYSLLMTGGTNGKDYTVQLVQNAPTPEPTTATLSLLALMALAARRRRKA